MLTTYPKITVDFLHSANYYSFNEAVDICSYNLFMHFSIQIKKSNDFQSKNYSGKIFYNENQVF